MGKESNEVIAGIMGDDTPNGSQARRKLSPGDEYMNQGWVLILKKKPTNF